MFEIEFSEYKTLEENIKNIYTFNYFLKQTLSRYFPLNYEDIEKINLFIDRIIEQYINEKYNSYLLMEVINSFDILLEYSKGCAESQKLIYEKKDIFKLRLYNYIRAE